MKEKIGALEKELADLKASQVATNDTDLDKPLMELMELRLQETLGEAKRHYNSYVDIREQYNSFV